MKCSKATDSNGVDSTTVSLLRQRFQALWRRCLGPGVADQSGNLWDGMEARYAEPHRYYHDAQHLSHCFEQLDLVRDQINRPDDVEMALWFHDVINDPGHTDNETRSAELFREWAHGAMEEDFVARVIDLILATTHRKELKDRHQQFICDIDLTSFGCTWERYIRDTEKLKAEHIGPEENYYRHKLAFLRAMLNKPRIFYTDFFHARYEHRARENIRRLLGPFEKRQG